MTRVNVDADYIYFKSICCIVLKESKRPGKTVPMIISCPMTLTPGQKDIIEYCKVDLRGYPVCRRTGYAFLRATVIVGHREIDDLKITPDDKVFTCFFGPKGHLSSVGKDLEGKELTVIVHSN